MDAWRTTRFSQPQDTASEDSMAPLGWPRGEGAAVPPGLGELASVPSGWGGCPRLKPAQGRASRLPQARLELGPMKMHVPFQKSESRSFLRKRSH